MGVIGRPGPCRSVVSKVIQTSANSFGRVAAASSSQGPHVARVAAENLQGDGLRRVAAGLVEEVFFSGQPSSLGVVLRGWPVEGPGPLAQRVGLFSWRCHVRASILVSSSLTVFFIVYLLLPDL